MPPCVALNFVVALMFADYHPLVLAVAVASSFASRRWSGSDFPFAPRRHRRGHATNCRRWQQGWPRLGAKRFVVLMLRDCYIG